MEIKIRKFKYSDAETIATLVQRNLPELQRKGIGKAIIQALENDELFARASRVEIPASKTACAFYEKMGYLYKNGVKQLDGEGHYRMEKVK